MFMPIISLLPMLQLLFFILHVNGSGSFPKPLSAKRERECLQRIQQGDIGAKNELIEHNLRLVVHIIKKYYSNTRDQEDLISIGTIGLIKAAASFDYEKGTRFATYASRCIENAILSMRLIKNRPARGLRVRAVFLFFTRLCAGFPGRFARFLFSVSGLAGVLPQPAASPDFLLGSPEAAQPRHAAQPAAGQPPAACGTLTTWNFVWASA